MFELSAVCESYRCGRHEFQTMRRNVTRKSTSGQPYTISQLVCPRCGMWATVEKIVEVPVRAKRAVR